MEPQYASFEEAYRLVDNPTCLSCKRGKIGARGCSSNEHDNNQPKCLAAEAFLVFRGASSFPWKLFIERRQPLTFPSFLSVSLMSIALMLACLAISILMCVAISDTRDEASLGIDDHRRSILIATQVWASIVLFEYWLFGSWEGYKATRDSEGNRYVKFILEAEAYCAELEVRNPGQELLDYGADAVGKLRSALQPIAGAFRKDVMGPLRKMRLFLLLLAFAKALLFRLTPLISAVILGSFTTMFAINVLFVTLFFVPWTDLFLSWYNEQQNTWLKNSRELTTIV